MNDSTNFSAGFDQTDDDTLYEVSDETLEAAADAHIEGQFVTIGPTIMVGGCC